VIDMAGRARMRITALLGAVAVLVSWGFTGMAEGDARNRALEKFLEKSGVAADERGQIQRAVGAAVRAGVPDREAEGLVEDCVEAEFPAAMVVRVLNLAAQLTLEGLPLESFTAKIEEGIAKRIDPDRIVQVAERRALMLNRAKRILDGVLLDGAPVRDRDELIPDVAEALEAGRQADEIQRILTVSFEEGAGVREIRRKFFP
jgi:hypothetical protein